MVYDNGALYLYLLHTMDLIQNGTMARSLHIHTDKTIKTLGSGEEKEGMIKKTEELL